MKIRKLNEDDNMRQMSLGEVENEYVVNDYADDDEYNELYDKGYRYVVRGDYRLEPYGNYKSWRHNLHFFVNKSDAEAYAAMQDHDTEVQNLTKRKPWWVSAEEERKKSAERAELRKQNKLDKDTKEAEKVGLSIEDYKTRRSLTTSIGNITKKIEDTKSELERFERELKKKQDKLAEIEAKMTK